MTDRLVGVDIGGTGVKAGLVDVAAGELIGERQHLPTPQPATPGAVVDCVAELVGRFGVEPDAPVGIAVPAVVKRGVVWTANNIDKAWLGFDAGTALRERLGRPVYLLNDADAAGYAESTYGAARGRDGVVMVTTLGTGIGTALFHDGVLVPNLELGRMELDGAIAEERAGNAAREREGLSWQEWAQRLSRYYDHLDRLISPDLFVVGGGVSQSWDKFGHLIQVRAEIVPAALKNSAGAIGAALMASRRAPGADGP